MGVGRGSGSVGAGDGGLVVTVVVMVVVVVMLAVMVMMKVVTVTDILVVESAILFAVSNAHFLELLLQVVDYVGGKRSALASLSLVSLTLLSLGYALQHRL